MTKAKRHYLYKLVGFSFAAFLSALGSIPYGFEFGYTLGPSNHLLNLLTGILLALAVGIGNTALGLYSLLHMQGKQRGINPILLRLLSFISAVPFGIMCFFAYLNITPFVITAFLTSVVYIVTAAIGYTAIFNFLLEMKQWHQFTQTYSGIACRMVGFLIGLAVSFTACMAAIAGCANLLTSMNNFYFNQHTIYFFSCIIGAITWIPFSFLFANATQTATYKIYVLLTDSNRRERRINARTIAILVLAICSGASYAQMTIVFFDTAMPIPTFLKQPLLQEFINNYLVPLAFIASAAVNYSALVNVGKVASEKKVSSTPNALSK